MNSNEQQVPWNLGLSPRALASLIASSDQNAIRVAPVLMVSLSRRDPSLFPGPSHPREIGVSGIIILACAISWATSKGDGGRRPAMGVFFNGVRTTITSAVGLSLLIISSALTSALSVVLKMIARPAGKKFNSRSSTSKTGRCYPPRVLDRLFLQDLIHTS